MELLLSACSTYDKKTTLPGKQKRAVYASAIVSDDIDDPQDGEYKVFQVDTDISDIMAYATDTNRFGNNRNGSKPTSSFLPREEWDKLTQEERDRLIAKRRQERMQSNGGKRPFQASRQANMHDVSDVVDLDSIIDYAIMNHDVAKLDDGDEIKEGTSNDDELLAYMAGRTQDTASAGDIRNVLAAKRAPDKGKPRKANESKSAPSTVQVDGTTYYLNKGETISFQGNQYFAHMTNDSLPG